MRFAKYGAKEKRSIFLQDGDPNRVGILQAGRSKCRGIVVPSHTEFKIRKAYTRRVEQIGNVDDDPVYAVGIARVVGKRRSLTGKQCNLVGSDCTVV